MKNPKRDFFLAKYCYVQYCPGRVEACNIGLILICDELKHYQFKTTQDLTRVERFFAPINKEELVAGLKSIKDNFIREVNSAEKLTLFTKKQFNSFQFTPILDIVVKDIVEDSKYLYGFGVAQNI